MWWAENSVLSGLRLSEQSLLCLLGCGRGGLGSLSEPPLPQAVLASLGGPPWLSLVSCCWAALEDCGFPALSALFAVGLPLSDLLSLAAWEAETLQGVFDITSLLGTSCGHVCGLLDTLLARGRACPG